MRLRDRFGAGLQVAQDLARTGITQASTGLQQVQTVVEQGPYVQYAQIGERVKSFVQERIDLGALQAAGFGAVGETLARRKREAQASLISLSAPVRARVFLAVREAVKQEAISDPDMWPCVRRQVVQLVDQFWDDLTVYMEMAIEDARQATLGRRAADVQGLSALGDGHGCCRNILRRWILYHYLPFDLSIFGQVKDPVFWLFTVISLVPAFGIRVCFFFLLLLLIACGCPPDEYQLVQYILMFKGTQFLSSGIGMALFASAKYYLCVHPGGQHTCDVDGPGVSSDLMSSSVDFLGSCLLVWIAFLLLPCSGRGAGLREIAGEAAEHQEPEPGSCCCCRSVHIDRKRGGRLAGLLGYDLLCFLMSCVVLCALVYADAAHVRPGGQPLSTPDVEMLKSEVSTWQFRSAIFWARMFYSFLALPFTVFNLPVLNSILTHTTPTGYNRNGLCVPYMLWPMETPEELQ